MFTDDAAMNAMTWMIIFQTACFESVMQERIAKVNAFVITEPHAFLYLFKLIRQK